MTFFFKNCRPMTNCTSSFPTSWTYSFGSILHSTIYTTTNSTLHTATHHRYLHGHPTDETKWYGTTILCVRKNGKVCMIGDGQVSMGNMIVKPNAKKIRRIYPKSVGGKRKEMNDSSRSGAGGGGAGGGGVMVGFAGSTADAFTLLERLEGKIDEYPGQLLRSCVELAKGWRTDKYLRRLEASLLVADEHISLEITGLGDVLESHDNVLAVGSGSPYAIAAARALQEIHDWTAEQVAIKAMNIASDMCVYTNKSFVVETMDCKENPTNTVTVKTTSTSITP